MRTSDHEHLLLPETFTVYVGSDGTASTIPAPGREPRSLPTVNTYTGRDGGYVVCHTRNASAGVYTAAPDDFVVGQIRLQGRYVDGMFVPRGYEGMDLSTSDELKTLADETFAACEGAGWVVGDTGRWFGLRADHRDDRDYPLDLDPSTPSPASVDLREWCSPVQFQDRINSCTANAAAALVEYFENRASGTFIEVSRLFLYKVTRNLMQTTGDAGANTRSTMKALALIGAAPEQYWPYDEDKVDDEPPAFCYALADRYRASAYHRLDVRDRPKEDVLVQAKASLARGRPLMFGMMAYQSVWTQCMRTGKFPFPVATDQRFGGHNMAIVGYDDGVSITNTDSGGATSVGAFLVKNSYGTDWGDGGYGWVPYDYLLKHQSIDWWTISRLDWLDATGLGT